MDCKCRNIADIMQNIAPVELAEDWDNVGLLVGDSEQTVKKIIVCLDITDKVIDEAIEKKVDMIITHHPIIFHPIKHVVKNLQESNLVYRLVNSGIAVYSAHTNLDSVNGGVNDVLCGLLSIKDQTPMQSINGDYKKIIVYVPEGYEDIVSDAMYKNGAGYIGKYSRCSFRSSGTGTFRPERGTNPFIGESGENESVNEIRIETICRSRDVKSIIDAMLCVHPYEEPAYDIYNEDLSHKNCGIGRIGNIDQIMTLGDFAGYTAKVLEYPYVKIVGDPDKKIHKIAVCGGSGSDLIDDAVRLKADAFITGDIRYHEARYAEQQGLSLIYVSHYAAESHIVKPLIKHLQKELIDLKCDIEVLCSNVINDPFKYNWE